MGPLLTCTEAAKSLSLSVSTIKRMCDDGILENVRTAGGHRRITDQSVQSFARRYQLSNSLESLLSVELFAQVTPQRLVLALLDDNLSSIRQWIGFHVDRRLPIVPLLEDFLAPAMWWIGNEWQHGRLSVYQEHVATLRMQSLLLELKRRMMDSIHLPSQSVSRPSEGTWKAASSHRVFKAVGGASHGDQHGLVSQMVELVFLSHGWEAVHLGSDLPMTELALAACDMESDLIWVSHTYVPDVNALLVNHEQFRRMLLPHQTLVLGGAGLQDSLRRRLRFDFFAESLKSLSEYIEKSFGGCTLKKNDAA